MELRHLKYFVTVAEELHFRKAAEKLFIAQPALSRQIKQLEEELGVALFKRTKRTVNLTEAGKYLKKEAQDVFLRLERAKNQAQLIETGAMGRIKIGYVPSTVHNVLPTLIKKLQENYPDLHLELHQMPAVQQYEMLKAEKLDIGFLRVPRQDKDIDTKVIFTETYSLITSTSHPVKPKNFKSLAQFSGDNYILTPRSAGERYFDNIISLCTSAGFSPKIVHESVYEHVTIKLVENNMGVSIVPSSFKDGFNAKVNFIELKDIPERLQLSMAWRKENTNPSLMPLIKMMQKTLL